MINEKIWTLTFFLLVIISSIEAYRQGPDVSTTETDDPNTYVHQQITNESQKVWTLIPYEIKNHLTNSVKADPNGEISFKNISTCLKENANFDSGNDVITGSGEEDNTESTCEWIFGNHFWNPDTPNSVGAGTEDYDDGLLFVGSSYRKALRYWEEDIIPNYLQGNVDKSYYYLGRVAHLLEDAAQPSHVHNDPHAGHWYSGGTSILEEHTGDNVDSYSGDGLTQYDYDNLIDSFDWSTVEPTERPSDLRNKELFRLFWYTAQKTQYWASDDKDGNIVYTEIDGDTQNWQCSGTGDLNLWADDGYTSCGDFISSGLDSSNVEQEANATIPHAMKSVAGLYKLFWDAVHIDWPTENHDYRRTGFTLLKGDLAKEEDIENQMDFFLDAAEGDIEQVVKPSIADLDGNGKMDMVVLVHKTTFNTFTNIYGIEKQEKWYGDKVVNKWGTYQIEGGEDGAIYFPPTLADIDGDGKKEIITGTRNGTVYAYDFDNGVLTEKWKYHLETRSDGVNQVLQFNGGSAVVDIDLDGDMEIIIADLEDNDPDWPGVVYVLNGDTGTNETSYIVGNGGAYASVSVANLDSDDYPEIVVPTQFGIIVLDYNPSTGKLTEKCSTTDAYLWGSAVIYDVDRDNDYEIIYVTSSTPCAAGKTCENKLHVIDPLNNCNEYNGNFPISFTDIPRPTPSVANLDSDSNMEIIIALEESIPDGLGSIKAIDAVSGVVQWTYNASNTLHPGFVSPNIADIDNDGNYNIILGENDGSTVYVLDNDGSLLFDYEVVGFMDNGLAIADLDGDGMAEIAFKRAASPETVFVSVSAKNTQPDISVDDNVTAIAGNLIDITSLVSATDSEGNNIEFFYSSPFNSSGLWQTNVNDTGNYSILVEASDGNLSTHQFVDVIVFNETTKVENTFSDSSTSKLLNYTQAGNLTVTLRLPKNATVIYSKLKMEGMAP